MNRHPDVFDRPTRLPKIPSAARRRRGVVFFKPGVVAEVRYLAGSQLRHATLQSLAFETGDGG